MLDMELALRMLDDSNNSSAAGAALDKLANFSGDMSVRLPCGRYITTVGIEGGRLTLYAEGNVLLFVNGNVQLERGFSIDVAPDARVTLIVKGSLNVGGSFSLGNTGDDRHLLIAGNGNQIHFNPGMNVVGGSVYAPTVQLVTARARRCK